MGLLVIQTTSASSAPDPHGLDAIEAMSGMRLTGRERPRLGNAEIAGNPRRSRQITCEDEQDCSWTSPPLRGGVPSPSRGSRRQAGSATSCLPWPRSPAFHAAEGAYESESEPRIRALMGSTRELIALINAQT